MTNGRGDRQQGPQMPDKAVDYSHSDLRSQPGDLRTTCNDNTYQTALQSWGKSRQPDRGSRSIFSPMNGGAQSTGYRPTWRSSVKTHAQSGERSE